jgi:BirA family biotin operon repressor/biotin-[acetyl-CoA-carboxylase] ligase
MASRLPSRTRTHKDAAPASPTGWPERFTVRWLAQVDSTNTALKTLAQAGAPDGFCLGADEQTAGRGQYGRTWHSPAGEGLYVSLLFRPPCLTSDQMHHVTTFAGLMVHDTLARFVGTPARLAVKEPNDVFLDGRKVAGILVEADWHGAALRFVIVGIGVNIGQVSFPEGLRQPATSLRLALGEAAPPRAAVLGALLNTFQDHWDAFLADPAGVVAARRQGLCLLPGTFHDRPERPY